MRVPIAGNTQLKLTGQKLNTANIVPDKNKGKRNNDIRVLDGVRKTGQKLSAQDEKKLMMESYLSKKDKYKWDKMRPGKKERIISRAEKSSVYRKFSEAVLTTEELNRQGIKGFESKMSVHQRHSSGNIWRAVREEKISRKSDKNYEISTDDRYYVSEQEKDEFGNVLTNDNSKHIQILEKNSKGINGKIAEGVGKNVKNQVESVITETASNTAGAASAGTSEVVKLGTKAAKKIAEGAKRTLQNNSYYESDFNPEDEQSSNIAVTRSSMGITQRISAFIAMVTAFITQTLTPVFVVIAIMITIISLVTSIISVILAPSSFIKKVINGIMNISASVMSYEPTVSEYAEYYGIQQYVPYLLAIMEVESHGEGDDVMQSSESMGLPPNSLSSDESIEQGVKTFAACIEEAKERGCDIKTVIQAYNYGKDFIAYVSKNGKEYSFELAEQYAKERSGGAITDYANDIAVEKNGGWRYLYGNMFYVQLIEQYVVVYDNESVQKVLSEAVKYNGDNYKYGGSNPEEGFDCSGLTQWCFAQAGILLPRTAQEQYEAVQHIEAEEIIPGDLVFFTDTTPSANYITHVAMYAGNGKVFEAGDPIGYYDFNDNWHQSHFVCGGRVIVSVETD